MIDTSNRNVNPVEIVTEAINNAKTEVIVSHVIGDLEAATTLIMRLKSCKLTNADWRYFQRSDHSKGVTKVYVYSPLCTDPAPPLGKKAVKSELPKIQEESGISRWVLDNLCDHAKGHVSVVPWQDVERLKGVSNYETYMTGKVRKQLHREDVRVMVLESENNEYCKKAYRAEVVFLG